MFVGWWRWRGMMMAQHWRYHGGKWTPSLVCHIDTFAAEDIVVAPRQKPVTRHAWRALTAPEYAIGLLSLTSWSNTLRNKIGGYHITSRSSASAKTKIIDDSIRENKQQSSTSRVSRLVASMLLPYHEVNNVNEWVGHVVGVTPTRCRQNAPEDVVG